MWPQSSFEARLSDGANAPSGSHLRMTFPLLITLSALLCPHQIGEALEQVMRVARARRRFRVVLHREYRLAVELDAAVRTIEQRDVGLRRAFWQGGLVHRKTVVHRGDLDLAGGLVLDWMI